MISLSEAWSLILPYVSALAPAQVQRGESLGRVLAADLHATVDVPPANVSAMDGYAVCGNISPGTQLPVSGTIAAGDAPDQYLKKDTAVRIMTGAPLPKAADRVVPIEATEADGTQVTIQFRPEYGAHIRRKGEIVGIGQTVLGSGSLITPGGLSVLATHGYDEVLVHRLPRVAVLATGDEVVPPSQVPGPGQLRDSHTDFLRAATSTLGVKIESFGIAPDEPNQLRALAAKGMAFDVFLLCGGVSMGEFDFVEDVLSDLGCDLLFDSVAMQPGKPLVAAHHPGGLVFGLPGNPASVMVSFWLMVRPALRQLMGLNDGFWEGAIKGILTKPLIGATSKDRFVSAEVAFSHGEIFVTPINAKGSHDLTAFATGTALLRIPAYSEPAPAGALCEILPLADWRVTAAKPRPDSGA
jgi:molybdopterin molybdotransferase